MRERADARARAHTAIFSYILSEAAQGHSARIGSRDKAPRPSLARSLAAFLRPCPHVRAARHCHEVYGERGERQPRAAREEEGEREKERER